MTIDRIDTTQDRNAKTVYQIRTEYESFPTTQAEVAQKYATVARVTAVTGETL